MPLSLESLWARAQFTPNPAQRDAIAHLTGPLWLTAGPGSGKTAVLVWRTLNLIVFHSVPPDSIFLGTFTEKGAHQLRERLRGLLALATAETGVPYDISRMAIGTVHSICHRLLIDRRLSIAGSRPLSPALLDEFDQYQFVYATKTWDALLKASELTDDANATITEYFEGRASSSRHRAVVNAISFFNRMSEESVDPAARRPREPVLRALLKMYATYLSLLTADSTHQRTDLSLIQALAYRRVKASPSGGRLFAHVIVDEYQDTNAIQEQLYFLLASGSKNLCVVGDDDQALYRFRGATVDNFLAFPERCKELLGTTPTTIPLVTNYRSRRTIVDFYNSFMQQFRWTVRGHSYRVAKTIKANSQDSKQAVFSTTPASPDDAAIEVAGVVKKLLDSKRVTDASQIAFLFPSLRGRCVEAMKQALEAVGLKVYAPRAGSFIEQDESLKVLGLLLLVFGNPGHRHDGYNSWLTRASADAKTHVRQDAKLAAFVKDRQEEIRRVVGDEHGLLAACKAAGLDEHSQFGEAAATALKAGKNISEGVRRFLTGGRLERYLHEQRKRRPDRPITVRYVINRACSLDWGVLDLFYQLTAFDTLRNSFDLAESGSDEGPICNLSLISHYLARFQEQTSPVIGAQFLAQSRFAHKFFGSYIYSIFRLAEGEYEDKEDPFPKGRIPFLTVHQAKGLEFPIVVLGNLRKDARERKLDALAAELGSKKSEPISLAAEFDVARMFYVALSRAQQALILCPFRGSGQRYREEFKAVMVKGSTDLSKLEPRSISPVQTGDDATPRPYSFTGDYIQYMICPRRYMLYRRYDFAPSRAQTTIFGNLVHRTIEDLHQQLIQSRSPSGQASP